MKIKNEALRMFLAITALILTAMLVNPAGENETIKKPAISSLRQKKSAKKMDRKTFAKRSIASGRASATL